MYKTQSGKLSIVLLLILLVASISFLLYFAANKEKVMEFAVERSASKRQKKIEDSKKYFEIKEELGL